MPKPSKYLRVRRNLDIHNQIEELKIEHWRSHPRQVHLLVVIHYSAKRLEGSITQGKLIGETKRNLKGDWESPHSLDFSDDTLRKYVKAYILYRRGSRGKNGQQTIPSNIKSHLESLPDRIHFECLIGLLAISGVKVEQASIGDLAVRLRDIQSIP